MFPTHPSSLHCGKQEVRLRGSAPIVNQGSNDERGEPGVPQPAPAPDDTSRKTTLVGVPRPAFAPPPTTASAVRTGETVITPTPTRPGPGSRAPTQRTNTRANLRVQPPASGVAAGEFESAEGALDKALDDAFTDATHVGPHPAGEGSVVTDEATQAEIQRLFAQIAAHHSAQIRDFVLELSHGDTTRQWAELCAPAVGALKRAAATIKHDRLVTTLEEFERALRAALRSNFVSITGDYRKSLLIGYDRLKEVLPAAFDVRSDRDRREPVIIDSLLRQVPGMHALCIARLYAAGVTSLSAFFRARPADLCATAGIDPDLARAIVEHFEAYRIEREQTAPDRGRKSERNELRSIIDTLAARETEYRQAEENEDRRRKREIRNERTALVQRLDLLLAQLGEIDLVNELKRIPVDRKIKRIDRYLRQPVPQ
jgi:hypothetical protein